LSRGARFYNTAGERFLEKVDPENLENTTRAKLVQAVYEETEKGHGPCMMDARHLEAPTTPLRRILTSTGVDYRSELIPWVLAVHSFLGGLWINEKGLTNVDGLYAAGEAAGHGRVFGADRVGGAIAACQVFGKRAGHYAALDVLENGNKDEKAFSKISGQVSDEQERLNNMFSSSGAEAAELLEEIRTLAEKGIGIVRDGPTLEDTLRQMQDIAKSRKIKVTKTEDLISALEIRNLAFTGILIAASAIVRKESRGQHKRKDFAQTAKDGLEWIIVQKNCDGELTVDKEKLPIDDFRLAPSRGDEDAA
jgi:succinate dehydrogenase/fumarate reductase flavoprotein subunit